MSVSVLSMSMSLDGYIADQGDHLGGDDGNRLHDWLVFTPDGEFWTDGPAGALIDEINATGAVLVGRRTAEIVDHWGGDHHGRGVPIFVPSHRPPGPSVANYPLVTYVTDGIASAMAQAKAAAGNRNVLLPMHVDTEPIYPDCPTTTRTVTVGGLTKSELLEELQRNAISINESAQRLFASDHFTTSATRYVVTTVELTVRNLGFPRGTTINEIYARAGALGLGRCPFELGPYLRLQYRDQPEGDWGKPFRQHQAPYGSLTIASETLIEDDDFPKGFYLRRIKGVLWLRGYRCGPEHVWEPDDHFIFRQT